MLSIIVCSRKAQLSEQFLKNILETVGVDFEVIVIDNSSKNYSIFSAYNEGVSRSQGDFLCFVHEDIIFFTSGWGKIVEEKLSDKTIGVIGVVGSDYMPKCPAGWWMTSTRGHEQKEVLDNGQKKKSLVKYSDPSEGDEVIIVDGFWFCMRKSLFNVVRFDDERFAGFHCYDNDICMQVKKAGFRVVIDFDILIEHKSEGVLNKQWVKNAYLWFKKWEKELPIGVTAIDKNRYKAIKSHCCNKYCTLSYVCGQYLLALQYYLKSIYYYPYKFSRWKIFIADYILHKKRTNRF